MVVVNLTTTSKTIPLLENGDCLTRSEFELRYAAMPSVKKAELIEGIVYMSSPVRVSYHGRPHAIVMTWLGTYWTATPGVDLCDNTTVRLDFDNEPQPDAVLRVEGGNSRIDEDDYIAGAPELIVEVAASSVSKDMNDKLKAYRRNGVQGTVMALSQFLLPLEIVPFDEKATEIYGSSVYADAGYTDYQAEDDLKDADDISLEVMRKRNSQRPDAPWVAYIKQFTRHYIETIFSEITSRFPKSIHAVTIDGFLFKVARCSSTFGIIEVLVFIQLCFPDLTRNLG